MDNLITTFSNYRGRNEYGCSGNPLFPPSRNWKGSILDDSLDVCNMNYMNYMNYMNLTNYTNHENENENENDD